MPSESRSTLGVPRWLAAAAAAAALAWAGLEVARALRPPEIYRAAPAGAVRWTRLEEAEAESARAGKPVLYDFSAAWCAPCKRMEREVWGDAGAARAIDERFVAVYVVDRVEEEGRNAPEVDELLDRFRVTAFPTLVVARGGREVGRVVGYPGRDRLLERLDELARSEP